MEDVLDVYHRPYDPARPVVCLDETSKQLLDHVRAPIAPKPAAPARVDEHYERCGTANIFAAIEPVTGRCVLEATQRRTAVDMAKFLRSLSDQVYRSATVIVLVMDNLNIHALSCLYEAFCAEEAHRLTKRFEVHYTPKHGSWLNVAEIFLSVLARQCLDQRIPSIEHLEQILTDWCAGRQKGKVTWHFTTQDARIKLRRLYPSIS